MLLGFSRNKYEAAAGGKRCLLAETKEQGKQATFLCLG